MIENPLDNGRGGKVDATTGRGERGYIFRGDDNYRGGPVGRAFGAAADAADIQNPADHVLRKESGRSSRYTSFTTEVKIARRFTSAADSRHVCKVEMVRLRDLESQGAIKIWFPDQVYEELVQMPKIARQAADIRAAMMRNREILIEGQIPSSLLNRVN